MLCLMKNSIRATFFARSSTSALRPQPNTDGPPRHTSASFAWRRKISKIFRRKRAEREWRQENGGLDGKPGLDHVARHERPNHHLRHLPGDYELATPLAWP